jgi:hypothetical protein
LGLVAALEAAASEGGSEARFYAALYGIPVGGALAGNALVGSGKRTLIYSPP